MVEGLQMLPPISGSRIICEYAGEALYLDAGSEETGVSAYTGEASPPFIEKVIWRRTGDCISALSRRSTARNWALVIVPPGAYSSTELSSLQPRIMDMPYLPQENQSAHASLV